MRHFNVDSRYGKTGSPTSRTRAREQSKWFRSAHKQSELPARAVCEGLEMRRLFTAIPNSTLS